MNIDKPTSQGMLRISGNHQKLERNKTGFFSRSFRGNMALQILLTRGLQNYGRNNFCFLKHPVCLGVMHSDGCGVRRKWRPGGAGPGRLYCGGSGPLEGGLFWGAASPHKPYCDFAEMHAIEALTLLLQEPSNFSCMLGQGRGANMIQLISSEVIESSPEPTYAFSLLPPC